MQHTISIRVSQSTFDKMTAVAQALECDIADVVERSGVEFKQPSRRKQIDPQALKTLVSKDIPVSEIAVQLKVSQGHVHALIARFFPDTPSLATLRASFGLYGRAKNSISKTAL